MKKNWVNLAVFDNLPAGQSFETFLNERGVEARTYNDKLLQLFLFLCPPHATFRVQVRQNDFKKAMAILDQDMMAKDLTQTAIHCPSCGSLRVQYPQMTRKFLTPTILLHLGIIFRVIDHQAYCEHCQYVWYLWPKNSLRWRKRATKPAFPLNN